MTPPEKARELRDKATPGPWRAFMATSGQVIVDSGKLDNEGDALLAAAAPELAKIVAGLRYEYTVQIGMEGKTAYAYMADTGKFRFGPLALADWWQTYGEADGLVADLKDMNPHTTACVVRRLAGDPEVDE